MSVRDRFYIMKAKKPRIIITGIAGFIGSNLAERLLQEEYDVVGIDNLSYGIREQVPVAVKFHELDIRSKDINAVFSEGDIIFHLAAKNSLIDCQNDPVETMDINVTGTANVFEAARLAGAKKVIYAQSSVLEEGEERLGGFYAISKMANQWIAEGYKREYGVTSVGLRYFNVYGPKQDYRRTSPPVMSKFIITLLKEKRPVIYDGDEENKRDFVYIDDINDFHLLCIADDRVNNRWFRIGSGESHSIAEVYSIIRNILEIEQEPIYKPRRHDDLIVAPLADITEAKELGWAPKTTIENGIREMIAYIKEEIRNGNIN